MVFISRFNCNYMAQNRPSLKTNNASIFIHNFSSNLGLSCVFGKVHVTWAPIFYLKDECTLTSLFYLSLQLIMIMLLVHVRDIDSSSSFYKTQSEVGKQLVVIGKQKVTVQYSCWM